MNNIACRRGMTLVELLAVVAILGLLVALLVPAVQAAREAARRVACGNKLRQCGIGLQRHHEQHGRFPPGGAADQPPFGSDTKLSGWGSSWLIYILPYIEQEALFSQMQFTGASGWPGTTSNPAFQVLSGKMIDTYRCPSTSLPPWGRSWGAGLPPSMLATYVGISGIIGGSGPTILPGFIEPRANPGAWGWTGAGGVLFPNSQITAAHVRDGMSNVLAASEHAGVMIATDGSRQPWASSYNGGFGIGASTVKSPPNYHAGGDNRAHQMTTIRYAINNANNGGIGWPLGSSLPGASGSVVYTGDCSATGVGYVGVNIPLNAPHVGGVNAAFCDGSNRFITDATALDVLARLATRDDGQTVEAE